MDSVSEFEEFPTERRTGLMVSPQTGSHAAAAPASESPVEHGLGALLAATGATGGSVRQSIGFTRPGSTPGDASAAGDDGAADLADLVNTLTEWVYLQTGFLRCSLRVSAIHVIRV